MSTSIARPLRPVRRFAAVRNSSDVLFEIAKKSPSAAADHALDAFDFWIVASATTFSRVDVEIRASRVRLTLYPLSHAFPPRWNISLKRLQHHGPPLRSRPSKGHGQRRASQSRKPTEDSVGFAPILGLATDQEKSWLAIANHFSNTCRRVSRYHEPLTRRTGSGRVTRVPDEAELAVTWRVLAQRRSFVKDAGSGPLLRRNNPSPLSCIVACV